ncbi:MAG: phosphate propanoyltransferase [Erysipelotrichaceae bacterium]|jgi:putative phosphotransacetylase|nr:phosphate propanoyltransferase [Erysipelotrichaceae bacterium]
MAIPFIVEISARHVHVSDSDLEVLFGKGYKLTPKKWLSQPGQYASEEKVTVVGPKKELANVSILGPTRAAAQVELSATDARSLGIEGVIRESGDIEGTPGCTLIGPAGSLEIKQGVIIAKRHIHFTPGEAEAQGVKDNDIVWVRVDTPQRSIIFGDVVIRVKDSFSAAMHVDTDEGNAAGITGGVEGNIVVL